MVSLTARKLLPPLSIVSGSPDAPSLTLTPEGEIAERQLTDLAGRFSHLSLLRYVIMPDHIHALFFVEEAVDWHLGTMVGAFKGRCTSAYRELVGNSCAVFFRQGFHDRILRGQSQLKTMHNYIADNPRRLLIRRQCPDLFTRRQKIVINSHELEVFGNIFLLRDPAISFVKVSSRYTPEQLRQLDAEWRRTIERGGVLVSPFISPKERVYRDLAIDSSARLIILAKEGFGDREKPMGRYFDLCAQGRLLIVAPPKAGNHKVTLTRSDALELNRLAELIAKGEFSVSLRRKR